MASHKVSLSFVVTLLVLFTIGFIESINADSIECTICDDVCGFLEEYGEEAACDAVCDTLPPPLDIACDAVMDAGICDEIWSLLGADKACKCLFFLSSFLEFESAPLESNQRSFSSSSYF
jgi:hypothetical protein